MTSPITLHFRISSHGRFLFVRELVLGEVVARIPTEKTTLFSADMDEVVRICSRLFIGQIQSVILSGITNVALVSHL